MKTKAQVIEWLQTSNPTRVILVEISGVLDSAGVSLPNFYLSNRSYGSSTTNYTACVVGSLNFTESLDFSGQPSIGYGDLEIENISGERDAWLQYIWANKSISILIGDASWPRDDFYQIFNGLVKDVDTRSRTSINLILVNKLQSINEPVSNVTINTGANSDQLVPLTFGECFNVTPLLKDSAQLEYQVHTGQIEDILEVRDNGKAVGYTKYLNTGTFKLTQSPFGTVTCTVQGDKRDNVYFKKIGGVIKTILRNYGKQLSQQEVNEANLDAVDVATNLDIGIYLTNRENVLDVCQKVAFSGGYYLVSDIAGQLKLVRLQADQVPVNGVDTVYEVTADDMEFRSLAVSQKLEVEGTIKLGYAKNWTVQSSNLAASLKPEAVAILQKEYYYTTATDSTTVSRYNQLQEPEAVLTQLISQTDAATEAGRLLGIKKSPRFVYTANYFAKMLFCELGDFVKITHPRFGLNSGKTGIAVSINRDWLRGRVTIGVFI